MSRADQDARAQPTHFAGVSDDSSGAASPISPRTALAFSLVSEPVEHVQREHLHERDPAEDGRSSEWAEVGPARHAGRAAIGSVTAAHSYVRRPAAVTIQVAGLPSIPRDRLIPRNRQL